MKFIRELLEMEDVKYQVIDTRTKKNIGNPSANRQRLQNKANKLDLEYGAVRYIVKRI